MTELEKFKKWADNYDVRETARTVKHRTTSKDIKHTLQITYEGLPIRVAIFAYTGWLSKLAKDRLWRKLMERTRKVIMISKGIKTDEQS